MSRPGSQANAPGLCEAHSPMTPTFDPATVEAVVFDIGGVFLYPHPRQIAPVLTELGVAQPSDDMAFREAHHAGVAALSLAAAPLVEAGTTISEPAIWATYDHGYAAALDVDPSLFDAFRAAKPRIEWDWLHVDNRNAFHELHASGMPLAIVSNNSGAAPEQMKQHGVCWVTEDEELPQVAAIIDSSLVGVAKPDPAIMTPALHALGLPPERVLYVGDTVHADVLGATAAGMQSVQLDPFDQHDHYTHARVHDLAALNELLG